MKTRSEVFQFEKELKWEHPAPFSNSTLTIINCPSYPII